MFYLMITTPFQKVHKSVNIALNIGTRILDTVGVHRLELRDENRIK